MMMGVLTSNMRLTFRYKREPTSVGKGDIMKNQFPQKLGAWSGIIAIGIWLVALWPLTHYLPPPSPALPTSEVAILYASNSVGIRLASILALFAISFTTLFYGTISAQMRQMEGTVPVWTYVQMLNGLLSLVGFVTLAILWATAAYRPGRSPEIVQAFHDESFLLYAMVAPPACLQLVAIGCAVFGDVNPIPLYPRWVAYFTIWTGILFLPGVFACMFTTGPFAWNGILSFWIPLIAFGLWLMVMCWAMLQAVKSETHQSAIYTTQVSASR